MYDTGWVHSIMLDNPFPVLQMVQSGRSQENYYVKVVLESWIALAGADGAIHVRNTRIYLEYLRLTIYTALYSSTENMDGIFKQF